MAPRDGTVKVGDVRLMSPQEALTEEEERQKRVENIVRGTGTSIRTDPTGIGAYFDLVNQGLEGNKKVASEPAVGLNMPGRVPTNPQIYGLAGQTAGAGIPGQSPQATPTMAEYLASMGIGTGGGGGAARPDFSAYRAALTDQAQQINAQIQAMYNALGEEAGANVGRIQDIYGGASEGIGDVYGSAIGNVGDAYSSAQQQAADQLARLGIEEAAPAVVNPMALSQAEAISQLEQGQAGGQAATERFGSAASGFGSQMAQVAQQQGTEMNAAVLASLQNRLMDSLAAEQSGGGGGGGGMSVRDQLALREAYNRDVLGELPLEEREFAFEQAQAAADPLNRFLASAQERVIESLFPSSGGKAAASPEELIQSEAAAYQQLRQALGLG
jgi:hypothetical protein